MTMTATETQASKETETLALELLHADSEEEGVEILARDGESDERELLPLSRSTAARLALSPRAAVDNRDLHGCSLVAFDRGRPGNDSSGGLSQWPGSCDGGCLLRLGE